MCKIKNSELIASHKQNKQENINVSICRCYDSVAAKNVEKVTVDKIESLYIVYVKKSLILNGIQIPKTPCTYGLLY